MNHGWEFKDNIFQAIKDNKDFQLLYHLVLHNIFDQSDLFDDYLGYYFSDKDRKEAEKNIEMIIKEV